MIAVQAQYPRLKHGLKQHAGPECNTSMETTRVPTLDLMPVSKNVKSSVIVAIKASSLRQEAKSELLEQLGLCSACNMIAADASRAGRQLIKRRCKTGRAATCIHNTAQPVTCTNRRQGLA